MVYYIERMQYGEDRPIEIYSGGHMFTSGNYDAQTFLELVRPGDTVFFGRHIRESQLCKTDVLAPLQWLVLEKRGTRLFLLNRYQVTLTLVSDGCEPFRYRDSYIREDLNGFLNEWFDSWELSLIEDTYLGETKNPAFGTSDDPGVSDKLFLLSAEEVLRYFDPAAYAHMDDIADKLVRNAHQLEYYPMSSAADAPVVLADTPVHAYSGSRKPSLELEICEFLGWWTRTPGSEDGRVALYESGGKLNLDGLTGDSDEVGVRPAMWLDTEKLEVLTEQVDGR